MDFVARQIDRYFGIFATRVSDVIPMSADYALVQGGGRDLALRVADTRRILTSDVSRCLSAQRGTRTSRGNGGSCSDEPLGCWRRGDVSRRAAGGRDVMCVHERGLLFPRCGALAVPWAGGTACVSAARPLPRWHPLLGTYTSSRRPSRAPAGS